MPEKPFHAHEVQRVVTVTGPAAPDELGLTDAHNHVWIVPPEGAAPGLPVLDDFPRSLEELAFYRQAGGGALVDCQPGGCGRDGRILARLARQSGVRIIACTGFHLRKYYPPEAPQWSLSAQAACDLFAGELQHGMRETLGQPGEEAARRRLYQGGLRSEPGRFPAGVIGRGRPGRAPDGRLRAGAYRERPGGRGDSRIFHPPGSCRPTAWCCATWINAPTRACTASWPRKACCSSTIPFSARSTTRSTTCGRCWTACSTRGWPGASPWPPTWPTRPSGRPGERRAWFGRPAQRGPGAPAGDGHARARHPRAAGGQHHPPPGLRDLDQFYKKRIWAVA